MTAVVETWRKVGKCQDLKFIAIQTSATAASGHTIDLNSDIADGRGVVITTVLHTYLQDDAGTNVASLAFDPATGILTLPSISTGIHNVFIIGF